MRMETFIKKALRLKAHHVVKVEEPTAGELVVWLERGGRRWLRCGACGQPTARVAATRRPVRRWQDLAMREHHVSLMYAPYRVWCRRCGLRVERVPWADPWQRVTHALARAVATLYPTLETSPDRGGPGPRTALGGGRRALPAELENGGPGRGSHGALGVGASPLGAVAHYRH